MTLSSQYQIEKETMVAAVLQCLEAAGVFECEYNWKRSSTHSAMRIGFPSDVAAAYVHKRFEMLCMLIHS